MSEHDECECEDCTYVNEDCPEQCSLDHEVDEGEVLECDATGRRWRYCCECGWELVSRYADDPTYINGLWYCDPYMHDYARCNDCSEWLSDGNAVYSERYECDYCIDCCPPEQGSEPGQSTNYCRTCGTHDLNLDLLREHFLCDCNAIARHLKGVPVQFADESVPVRFLRRLAA